MISKKRMVIGTAAVILVGTACHFLFELLGGSRLAAPFFAVNESVWEHMKLLRTAAFVWMAADWFLADKAVRCPFFTARAAALPVALLSIPMLFYFVEGAFGVENLIVDIALFLLSSILYQYLALKLEIRFDCTPRRSAVGIAVLAVIFLLFAVFTFLPPHLPLFRDSHTGMYGILR